MNAEAFVFCYECVCSRNCQALSQLHPENVHSSVLNFLFLSHLRNLTLPLFPSHTQTRTQEHTFMYRRAYVVHMFRSVG